MCWCVNLLCWSVDSLCWLAVLTSCVLCCPSKNAGSRSHPVRIGCRSGSAVSDPARYWLHAGINQSAWGWDPACLLGLLCCSCNIVTCRVVSCRAVLCCVFWCCVVLRCVVLYCVVLCFVVLCCVVLYCAVLCCTVLCCIILCCAVLSVVLCCVPVRWFISHPSSKCRDRMLPLAGVNGTGSEVIKEDDGGCSQQKAARDRNHRVYRLTCDKNPGRV